MFTGLDPPASTTQEDSAVGYTNELALQDSEGIPGEDAGPEAGFWPPLKFEPHP